ncbi:DEAD/DEAH box helicase [Alteribacter keqinensis]|uniref:DEAD/DEAH box helicase n=1 Tax=Alteribacter keqinensis TaxID=2483800 RepID=A0A3M7TWV0_9BACI|nr:DEAD/DEAH box helicase [Alteribacter keqinensis]RNA70078.1 DEAD/DEAH box helicase [Alteribacter keqinensis]
MNRNVNIGLLQNDTQPAWFVWADQNSSSREGQLLFKQQLFRNHDPSFYGTAFPVKEVFDETGGSVTGTVIPEIPDGLFTELTPWLEATSYPTRYGRWTKEEKLDLPLFSVRKDTSPSYKWIIDGLAKPSSSSALDRLAHDHDDRIRKWIRALESPDKMYELPLNLYEYCLDQLGHTKAAPFQLSLAINEPDLFSDEWSAELIVTETATKKTASLKDVTSGHHSFVQNPVPAVKPALTTLSSSVPALHGLSLTDPKIKLKDEEVYSFLHSYQDVCEQAGINVLVPQSWDRPVQLSVTGEVSPSLSGSGATVSWLFSHHDKALPEDKLREWVDEQRHFIYFDNRWMHWDLQKASEYLRQIDRIRKENTVTLFQAIQQIAYMPDAGAGAPPLDEPVQINWTLSDTWFDDVTKAVAPVLDTYWKHTLKPYQQEGSRWLLAMRKLGLGCCLADDMGLGKTVQAIAYADHIERDRPVLIVCPTSLLENWVKELNRFAPHLKQTVYYGAKATRQSMDLESGDVVLTTYALLLRDSDVFQKTTWASVLFDEAQMIKNNHTKIWKEAKSLSAHHRIAITGTPVENRLAELWSLFDWFAEGYLGSLPDFLIRFSADPSARLKNVIAPFVLRRTKEQQRTDWKLPSKTNRTLHCDLTREQHLLYQAVVEETLEAMEFLTPHERKGVFFKGITRLKQICNHPAHFLDERRSLSGRSGKWETVMKTMETLLSENKRTVLFTQYKKMGYLIEEGLRHTFGMEAEFLNGSMKMRDRFDLVERFNRGETAPVLLVSIRAGGTGLNMTGATEVIHYDRWWNPAVDDQASDRVHRIGQTKPVTIHSFTTRGTIEESIEAALHQKKEMYTSLFGGERHTPVWEMDTSEVKSLFYGRY